MNLPTVPQQNIKHLEVQPRRAATCQSTQAVPPLIHLINLVKYPDIHLQMVVIPWSCYFGDVFFVFPKSSFIAEVYVLLGFTYLLGRFFVYSLRCFQ